MCFTKDMQVRGGKQAGIVKFPRKKNLGQEKHFFSLKINCCKILDVNVKGYTACDKAATRELD